MVDKVLITGVSGLVGSRFAELFPRQELLLTPSESEFNLLHPATIKSYLAAHPAGTIVNFAAFTNVSAAETEKGNKSGLCWQLNVGGVKNITNAINPTQTHFIQISTDMVFSGSTADPGPYPEDHEPETDSQKLTWYGYSKSQGELATGSEATIVRICNPVRAKFPPKLDYFRKPLSLFDQGKLYPLFTDQRLTISFIDEVARALQLIISDHRLGTFHVSSSDVTTPYEIISYLLEEARHKSGVVKPLSITSTNDPVRYPRFGGLKSEVTQATLGIKFSPVKRIIDQLISQGLTV